MESIEKTFQIPTSNLVFTPKGYRSSRKYPLLVALHGMGMTAAEFAGMLEPLRSLPVILLVPDGVYPFEIRTADRHEIGRAWYQYTGDEEAFVESMERSGRHLKGLIRKATDAYRVDTSRVALLGFSQGGYFAGYYGIRHAKSLAGLIVIGARVKHEVLERELSRTNDLQVLLLHGKRDRAVPLQVVERSHRFVQAALGTPSVTLKTYPCGHTLTPDQLDDAGGWLREVFRIR